MIPTAKEALEASTAKLKAYQESVHVIQSNIEREIKATLNSNITVYCEKFHLEVFQELVKKGYKVIRSCSVKTAEDCYLSIDWSGDETT